MKFVTAVCALLAPLALFSAEGPLLRQTFTTNQVMNAPQDGWIAIWNATAAKWSNGINTSAQTNIPAYLQTSTLTNLAGTGLNTEATNTQRHIEDSPSGKGTNTTFYNAITNRGNMFVASNQWVTQNLTVAGSANVGSFTNSGPSTNAGVSYFGSAVTFHNIATNFVNFVTKGSGTSGFLSQNSSSGEYLLVSQPGGGFFSSADGPAFFIGTTNVWAWSMLGNRNYVDLQVDGNLTVGGTLVVNGSNHSIGNDITLDTVIINGSIRLPRGASVTTDSAGKIAFDTDAWAAGRGAIQYRDGSADAYVVGVTAASVPADGYVPVWHNGGFINWEAQSGTGGGGAFNANQFSAAGVTNIKDGALFTNINIYTALTLPTLTTDRAAGINSSGQLTNSANVTMTELEFLDGVTSAIQTQINTKQNGGTNANQFGASGLLTIKDGAIFTNTIVSGTLHVTNPPGATAALRLWQTNANSYTEFTVPSQWFATNRNTLWLTNPAAGHVLKVTGSSGSSGVVTFNWTNDFVAGTEVTFADPDNVFVATSVSAAIAELNDVNGSGPNASDGKVHWSQLVGVPAGFADGIDATGSSSTNNLVQGMGYADVTNSITRWWVHQKDNTNVVIDWSKTNYVICSPSNSFAVSWANVPAAGSHAQTVYLEIVNTNSTAGFFPTNGLNNTPPILLAAPSTNTFAFQFDGTNFWIESGQILTTGSGDTNVFNVTPDLFSANLKGRPKIETATNIWGLNYEVQTRLILTNNAISNITVNFGTTNYLEIWTTNNLTFTNWTGIADDGQAASVTALIRPQLINRGVNWGNLGLSNPGYGVAIATNMNSPMWTTLTNAKTYALAMTRVRTNIFVTLTLWE